MARLKFIFSVVMILLMSLSGIVMADMWDDAARNILRVKPEKFTNVPDMVMAKMKSSGCTIPQTYAAKKIHNVISGEFAKKGQQDWAILCSDGGVTSILVFWGGKAQCLDEFAISSDRDYMQGIGGGKIAYSRMISTVDGDYIQQEYEQHGGNKPPPITHDGIDDAFVESASIVHYCEGGKWLELTGAD